MLFATLFIACHAASEEVARSLPADDECGFSPGSQSCALAALQRRGTLAAAEIEVPQSATDGGDRFEQDVQAPLRAAALQIKNEVSHLIFLTAKKAKANAKNHSDVLASGVAIRKLVADIVPKVLAVRDVSSAVDKDPRPKDSSRATRYQSNLETMSKYQSWAWPVILDSINSAVDDNPALSPHVEAGINGSLNFLEPVLKKIWNSEKLMIPVVKDLVSDVGNSSAAMLEKASCSSSFAKGLGDLTSLYANLAEARHQCSAHSTPLTCAQDVVLGYAHVAGSISKGSEAMWECFGISWECSRIINSALEDSIRALSTSLEISSDCSLGKASCRYRSLFAAYGDLWSAAASLELAAGGDSCRVKGSSEPQALNPNAATPADLTASLADVSSNGGLESFKKLLLMDVVSSAAGSQMNAVAAKTFSEVSASIGKLLKRSWSEAVEGMETQNSSGLVALAGDVLDVMRADVPKFLEAVKESKALSRHDIKDGPALKQRELAQEYIITMMEFTISNAPKFISKYAAGDGSAGSMTDEDFFALVDGKINKAQKFFGKVLTDAWEGLSLHLPRIQNLSESVEWAGCAAEYAESLGALTELYSGFASTGTDCRPGSEWFDAEACESDVLTDFSSLQNFVTLSSNMMQTCFHDSWKCAQATSRASKAMLSTMTKAISATSNCEGSDVLDDDTCKSLALEVLGDLVSAADAVDASQLECTGSSLLEEHHDDDSSAAPSMSILEKSLGSSAASWKNSGDHSCDNTCHYGNYHNAACQGTTCVCTGGGKRTHRIPGECKAVRGAPKGHRTRCNKVCTLSSFFRGTCRGGTCTCSGGKGHMTIPGHC